MHEQMILKIRNKERIMAKTMGIPGGNQDIMAEQIQILEIISTWMDDYSEIGTVGK